MKYKLLTVALLVGVLFVLGKIPFSKETVRSDYANVYNAFDENVLETFEDTFVSDLRNKINVGVNQNNDNSKNVVASTTKTFTKPISYSGSAPVVWNFYLDDKFWFKETYFYPLYSQQTFYIYDETYEFWKENGFFIGTRIGRDAYLNKGQNIWNISINGPTELNTYFQSCAELSSEHVFFKSVNALERKIVQFANNKGDTKVGIKAGGEIAAVAVVYSDGGVCAKFTEGCTEGVTCDLDEDLKFIKSYKEKSINKIIEYHTHDYNTYDAMFSKSDGYYVNNKGEKVVVVSPAPSVTDLKTSHSFVGHYNNIFPNVKHEFKVISPDGEGYIYSVQKKSKIANQLTNNFKNFEKEIFNGMSDAQDASMTKDKRTDPNVKDAKIAIEFAVKKYKALGANLQYFKVK